MRRFLSNNGWTLGLAGVSALDAAGDANDTGWLRATDFLAETPAA